jgi:hypothetical protein
VPSASSNIHERFFLVAGLVRHEFWLHGQDPANYGFEADPDALTLRSIQQQGDRTACIRTLTEKDLVGDLHAIARAFYKELCKGGSKFARDVRRK